MSANITPQLKTLCVPIDTVHLDPGNVRKHPPEQLSKLKGSLTTYGQVTPLTVQESTRVICKGNATWQAAKELEWDVIAVNIVNMDDRTARSYALADNRLSELSEFELEPLGDALRALKDDGVDVVALGWTEAELKPLLDAEPPALVEVETPVVQEAAITQPGDLWLLGEHRLLCGDATKADDVGRVMGGKEIVVFTDPPYGINYDPSWLDGVSRKRNALSSRNTLSGDDGSLDLSFLWSFDRRFVWGFPYIFDRDATGWIVWDKQPGVESRGIVAPVEMASTTMRKGFDVVRCMWGGYYRAAGEERMPHPTQKPVKVMTPFIEALTGEGDIILDPFLGSGTTLIAAEQLGRVCHGIEIEPRYVDVTIRRWQTLTGQNATRESDGATFTEAVK